MGGESDRFQANPVDFSWIGETLLSLWPSDSNTRLMGIVLFGSHAKSKEQRKSADWDIGVVFSGPVPRLQVPEHWDLFLWSKEHWEAGFALQVEIARHGIILLDTDGIIQERFAMIREKILPFWGGYLRRF